MDAGILNSHWGVFIHHIYEYKKGLRDLILHTDNVCNQPSIIRKLQENSIAYRIVPVNKNKINVFFGNALCIAVIHEIAEKPLNRLTDEEDFILGIMLGYGRKEQCRRFLKRKQKYNVPRLAG